MILQVVQLSQSEVLALFGGGATAPSATSISALVPTGTTQASAAPVISSISIVTGGSGGVLLEVGFPLADIRNRCSAAILVWPPLGEQLDNTSAPNMPVTLQPGDNANFIRLASMTPPTWFY